MNRFYAFLLIGLLIATFFVFYGLVGASAEDEWSKDWASRTATAVIPGGIYLAGTPENCTTTNEGAMHYAPEHKAVVLCNGTQWMALQAVPLENGAAP